MTSWSFLTSHARVLLRIGHDPGAPHRGQPDITQVEGNGRHRHLCMLAPARAASCLKMIGMQVQVMAAGAVLDAPEIEEDGEPAEGASMAADDERVGDGTHPLLAGRRVVLRPGGLQDAPRLREILV